MLKMTIAIVEYNLFLVVFALQQYLDITAFYSVVTIGSLITIKLINFADGEENKQEQNYNQEYVNVNQIQTALLAILKLYLAAIDYLTKIQTLKQYLKIALPLLLIASVLNCVPICVLLLIVPNGIFVWQYLKEAKGIDLCQKFEDFQGLATLQIKAILQTIPQSKQAKKVQ